MRHTRDGAEHGPAYGDTEFEAKLRELLEQETDGFRAGEAPYTSILRQGRNSRRRRMAAAGAGLAALVALPGAALAVHFQPDGQSTTASPAGDASPAASVSAPQSVSTSPAPSVSTSAPPSGPEGPATAGQLVDGITLERAGEALEKCIAFNKAHQPKASAFRQDYGKAEDYRVILALSATGDVNSPGDGIRVVAVGTRESKPVRLICTEKDGQASGLNGSMGSDDHPGSGPVIPDSNAFRLYKQDTATGPGLPYRFPFRWGSIGTVKPEVAEVTVSYGGVTRRAVLDHGCFVATGVLTRAATSLPHIKGYDAAGKLVYDSAKDKGYQ
ncbi:hypothetical protein [Streptomyces sp. NPDC001070]